MTRQIVKGLTMLMLIVGLALASAAVANGQSQRDLRARVPFDFIVSEAALRAGEYEVRAIGNSGVWVIAGRDSKKSELRLSNETQNPKLDFETNAKLVFHRYGNTYFLDQVWLAGQSTGYELLKTRQERAIERELNEIAKGHGESKAPYEVVEIVAAAEATPRR